MSSQELWCLRVLGTLPQVAICSIALCPMLSLKCVVFKSFLLMLKAHFCFAPLKLLLFLIKLFNNFSQGDNISHCLFPSSWPHILPVTCLTCLSTFQGNALVFPYLPLPPLCSWSSVWSGINIAIVGSAETHAFPALFPDIASCKWMDSNCKWKISPGWGWREKMVEY